MTSVCADVKEVMRQDMVHALTAETLSMEGKASHYAIYIQGNNVAENFNSKDLLTCQN